MNRHAEKPACHSDFGHQRERLPAFRDGAQVCYARDSEIERLTPGCAGCGRRGAKDPENDSSECNETKSDDGKEADAGPWDNILRQIFKKQLDEMEKKKSMKHRIELAIAKMFEMEAKRRQIEALAEEVEGLLLVSELKKPEAVHCSDMELLSSLGVKVTEASYVGHKAAKNGIEISLHSNGGNAERVIFSAIVRDLWKKRLV